MIAFPGEEIKIETSKIGPGLIHKKEAIIPIKAGKLREAKGYTYIDNNQKRYVPQPNEPVIGTIVNKYTDNYKVDLGSAVSGNLDVLAFEGAIKRNKPSLNIGNVVFCRVVLADKDLEPELECVGLSGKSEGFGELQGGNIVTVSLRMARILMDPKNIILQEFAKHSSFEIVVGINGRVWINGDPHHVLVLSQLIKQCDSIAHDKIPGSGLSATRIFQENATEERAENARLSSFVGAIAVGDLVKSTLGPKGMNVMVTNDGATILKSIALDNAAAKVLVNISKVQDDEVGDGTTSVCVLAAELLREAERLVNQKVHPQTIIDGYRIASAAAYKALEASAIDNSTDQALFRTDLINIAKTTLSSKVLSQDKEYFANLAVDAVLRLKGSTNLDHIQIIKKPGGKLLDSYLDEGFILDKKIGVNQPKRVENANILIANTPMDTDKIKIFGARVRVDATGKLAELERAEKEKMKEKVEKIKKHGINCFVNRQLIYNYPEQLFADSGITAIEHADFDGIERLALVTGGEIASTFDHPELVKLGHCDLIEEIIIGEDKLIKFSGVAAGEACTIVLRGASNQLLDEAERSLHDALCVLSQTVKEPKTVLGGGCSEMLMSNAVEKVAVTTAGKKALAIEAFARALRQMPTILADNAGYDSSELVARLRAAHAQGQSKSGLDMYNADIADMTVLGITESFKLKRQVLLSASEACEMILRVDDIIRCAPR
ncbi:T-complex protein 1 subunit beta [Boothiomyces sp. JEL0838]|nr:T-complex protein 1 subunit beta [Boothiomyces sp. JEL0838]